MPSLYLGLRSAAWIPIAAIWLLTDPLKANDPATIKFELNESHLHLTNNIQDGDDIRAFLTVFGHTGVFTGITIRKEFVAAKISGKVASLLNPAHLEDIKKLLERRPDTTIVWAHTGMGRMVCPIRDHVAQIQHILSDPDFCHVPRRNQSSSSRTRNPCHA